MFALIIYTQKHSHTFQAKTNAHTQILTHKDTDIGFNANRGESTVIVIYALGSL